MGISFRVGKFLYQYTATNCSQQAINKLHWKIENQKFARPERGRREIGNFCHLFGGLGSWGTALNPMRPDVVVSHNSRRGAHTDFNGTMSPPSYYTLKDHWCWCGRLSYFIQGRRPAQARLISPISIVLFLLRSFLTQMVGYQRLRRYPVGFFHLAPSEGRLK